MSMDGKIKAQRGKAAEDAACQWSRREYTPSVMIPSMLFPKHLSVIDCIVSAWLQTASWCSSSQPWPPSPLTAVLGSLLHASDDRACRKESVC